MEDIKLTWSKKLELRRCLLGLTQEEIALKIGVPKGTYGRWERGESTPMAIYKKVIAEKLELDEKEIFGGED